jgi:hypothetical protein
MTKRLFLAITLSLFQTTAPVLADQVLYCIDTNSAGFIWDKSGAAALRRFHLDRFTVKLEPATGLKQVRTLTQTTGGGDSRRYDCSMNLMTSEVDSQGIPLSSKSPVACNDVAGAEPWVFFPDNTYTQAFLLGGPPSGGGHDPNIWISYGVCTPF